MNEVLLRVQQIMDDLPKSEKNIAKALLANPNAIVTRSITEYSEYVSSSTASITRFSKRIGLSGFPELRIAIARDLTYEDTSIGEVCNKVGYESESTEAIISEVLSNTVFSINQLSSIISEDTVERAVDLIQNARNILLCGIGASGLVANDCHQKLIRLGILSHFEQDLDVVKVKLSSFDERDVVILFSYSGKKSEIKTIARLAKKKNAKVIAITKLGNTPISLLSDVYLPVAPTEALIRQGATVSRIQMLLIVDVLFQELIHRDINSEKTLMETWSNVSVKGAEDGDG